MLGLSQGRLGVTPVVCLSITLTDTPPGAKSLSGRVHLPVAVLVAAIQYGCKSRAQPAAQHLAGSIFPPDLGLGSCITLWWVLTLQKPWLSAGWIPLLPG